MKDKLLIAAILSIACVPWASMRAQQNPSSMANSGGAEATSAVGKYANMDQLMNKQTGSMQFFGKVAMAAGKLPWDPIPVVVTCGDTARYNTVADAKGGFYIVAPARSSEVISQKKDPNHAAPSELVGCRVSAVVDGFTSTRLTIANRTLEDDPSLGTIMLSRDEHAASSSVSSTTESAAPDALKEFDKAHSDDLEKHFDSARHHLQKAVSIDPKFAEAWYHLGQIEQKDSPQDALSAYEKAAAADPSYIPPYEPIAELSALQKNWQAVTDATNQALKLNPAGTPQVWYYNAVGNLNLGNRQQAETSAETSLSMDPSHRAPNTEQLLAVMLAGRGEYAGALEHLRHCLTYMPPGPNVDVVKQQIAQLEKVAPLPAK
ncbi:MAG: tetratricopeptide repeat protein [Acidobacteriaceae bacterium]|jgi:tetratricopeptide (TPR) repeat protein